MDILIVLIAFLDIFHVLTEYIARRVGVFLPDHYVFVNTLTEVSGQFFGFNVRNDY